MHNIFETFFPNAVFYMHARFRRQNSDKSYEIYIEFTGAFYLKIGVRSFRVVLLRIKKLIVKYECFFMGHISMGG